jgi:hypothetical protein
MGCRKIVCVGYTLPKACQDYERYATTLAGLHVVAFVGYTLKQAFAIMQVHDGL